MLRIQVFQSLPVQCLQKKKKRTNCSACHKFLPCENIYLKMTAEGQELLGCTKHKYPKKDMPFSTQCMTPIIHVPHRCTIKRPDRKCLDILNWLPIFSLCFLRGLKRHEPNYFLTPSYLTINANHFPGLHMSIVATLFLIYLFFDKKSR